MRTLTATLTATQKLRSVIPYPKTEIYNRRAGVTRLIWTRHYSGSEVDYFHAACMPSDGSLNRFRVDSADNTLYRQRVTSPAAGSDYATWTSWGVTAYAVAAAASGTNILVVYARFTDGDLYYFSSTDSGATWTAATLIGAESLDADNRIAVAFKDANTALLIWNRGSSVGALDFRTWNGSAWSAAGSWSNSMVSISGLAAYSGGTNYDVIVTGQRLSTGRYGVYTCVYDPVANTWTTLDEMTIADETSNVTFSYPSLGLPDVERLFFIEAYSGSETYSRVFWSHMPATAILEDNLWLEPVPFDISVETSSTYGLDLIYSGTTAWLSNPRGVWSASLTAGSIDVTADMIYLETDIQPTSDEVTLILRNADKKYNTLGSGDTAAIREGSEIVFAPGYVTSAGQESSASLRFWINSWSHYRASGGESLFILQCSGSWGLLRRWRARRTFTWAAGAASISNLFKFIYARVGLEFSTISVSNAFSNQTPAFSIDVGAQVELTRKQETTKRVWEASFKAQKMLSFDFSGRMPSWQNPMVINQPTIGHWVNKTTEKNVTVAAPYDALGATGADAIMRLLEIVPDVLFHRANYGYTLNPLAADASTYSYGTDHSILESNYVNKVKWGNRMQVFGNADFTEDYDWTEIANVYDTVEQTQDINLTNTTKTGERASAMRRWADINALGGYIKVMLNCGQELWDVIDITDEQLGLSASKRRVIGLKHVYNSNEGQYSLTLELGDA